MTDWKVYCGNIFFVTEIFLLEDFLLSSLMQSGSNTSAEQFL